MQLSKRVQYLLLAFLILLNITFRYPLTPHEVGADSFYIHAITTSISSSGLIKWIIHPLSFFGLYPHSASSAVPALLSEGAQCMGITIEFMILLLSMLLGVFAALGSFLMAREIKDDYLFAFLVAFLFSLSPVFLRSTIWTVPTRSLFVVFFPLFIWSLLRIYHSKKHRWIYIGLAQVLFLVLLASHHIALFLPLIILAYLNSILFYKISGKVKIKRFSIAVVYIGLFVLLLSLQIFRLLPEEYLFTGQYRHGFFSGTSSSSIFLNMCVDYGSRIGFLSIFGLFGAVYILRKREKKVWEFFLLITLLIFAPFLTLGLYVSPILLPFFCIVVGLGFYKTVQLVESKKMAAFSIIGAGLMLSVAFSGYMIDRWAQQGGQDLCLSDDTVMTSMFLKEYGRSGFFISNNWARAYKIWAISSVPALTWGDFRLMYDLIDANQLNIRMISFEDISPNIRTLYYTINMHGGGRGDWTKVMQGECDSAAVDHILSTYNITFAIEENDAKGKYLAYGLFPYDSPFFQSLDEKKYIVYKNSKHTIYVR